jgi:hypothetical protein
MSENTDLKISQNSAFKKIDYKEQFPTFPDTCHECGNQLIFEQGCKRCIDDACGWSACSK